MSNFKRGLMMAQGGGGVSVLEPCIYTTTSTNESVRIITHKEYAQRIYLEDGTELDVSGTGALNYTFKNIGEHKVYIKFKKQLTSLASCFTFCSNLTIVPESLFSNNIDVTNFNGCFGVSGIISIPEKLFAKNTHATNFGSCFEQCSMLTSNCPIDNDGTPIYNRSGNGKEGYAIVTSYSSCFRNATKMSDYSSIPSGWK